MTSTLAFILSIFSTGIAAFALFINRDKRIDEKISSKINDCVPLNLEERFGAMNADLVNIKESLIDIKSDLKGLINRRK